MSVRATNGLTVHMSNGTTSPATVTATGITNAKPAVVTAADTSGMEDGQMVTMSGTKMASLDGKTFIVGGLTATTFELIGSDAVADTAGVAGTATYYDDVTDMVPLCLSSIAVNAETSSPISVGTFCDGSAQIPGPDAAAGSYELGFFLDKDSAGYCALLKAEADGLERMLKITFPGNGDLVAKGVVSGVVFTDVPLEGSVSLTATVTLSSKPVHVFNCA